MPTPLTNLPTQLKVPRKLWTRAEYETLSAPDLDLHLELIEGELIDKKGKPWSHVISVVSLHEWLSAVFGFWHVALSAPIDVAPEDNRRNEPEPDLIVLPQDTFRFRRHNPRPEDVSLVIEVADKTLVFDLTTKADLYARAGIADYWVLDIAGRRMLVHREPNADRYTSVIAYAADEGVAPLAAPASHLRVGDIFAS